MWKIFPLKLMQLLMMVIADLALSWGIIIPCDNLLVSQSVLHSSAAGLQGSSQH
jgi:hypothetical protein